jgi:hypothetical protein
LRDFTEGILTMSINTTENRYSAIRQEAERLGAFFEVTRAGVVATLKQHGATVSVVGRNIDDAARRLVVSSLWASTGPAPVRLVGHDRPAFLAE